MTNLDATNKFLLERWQIAGIKPTDTVLLHCDIFRTLIDLRRRQLDSRPEIILESFLALLSEGTLLMPAFNFGFAHGKEFHMLHTTSEMGHLTELARKDPRAERTGHPIYSFSVFGKNRKNFVGLENHSGYGNDSPFSVLRQCDGKIATLDVSDERCMTFIHHVEENHSVPYRYHKEFTGPYINKSGNRNIRSFSLFVRNLKLGVVTDVKPFADHLFKEKAYTGDPPMTDSGLRAIDAKALYNYTSRIIRDGGAEGMLYRVSKSKP